MDRHVFIHTYGIDSIKLDARGDMGHILAIPKNPHHEQIIRYQNYLELNKIKQNLISPNRYITKMASSGWNCIGFFGVNSSVIKELYRLFPIQKDPTIEMKNYNKGLLETTLNHILINPKEYAIPYMFLEPR